MTRRIFSRSRIGLCLGQFEQRPGVLLRTLVALVSRLIHETPGSGRMIALGLSPHADPTPLLSNSACQVVSG
jgi:hypothetical protein